MAWDRRITIEFRECDPAGIVFYPRYFEMLNSTVEAFFAEVVGRSFRRIVMDDGGGLPTVHAEADYSKPSRLGDVLTLTLDVERVGTSSASFLVTATGDDGPRVRLRSTVVWLDREGRGTDWPQDVRTTLLAHCKGPDQ